VYTKIHDIIKNMKVWKRAGRKRLSVDIPEELHKKLVFMAKRRNCTITKYVIRAIIYKLSLKER
jgi:predicted HicB family RNase H-like nuclease